MHIKRLVTLKAHWAKLQSEMIPKLNQIYILQASYSRRRTAGYW